ncbi:hypothetical protein JQ543_17110 [Bradyrhizobium diazoefficiens]|nr:hypothetical protein [Bradyrhizobium diazoefficiens]MBR0849475.1 hypothetical protein [Bradyrhizobium diazoefficiens]
MTPKKTYSLVLEKAKRGTLIDRCGVIVFYIAAWVGLVCASFPMLFPREYFWVIACGIPFGLVLLALAILGWLKRRHL